MKILLYGLNFTPELTGIGKYTGEMALWLSQAGHDVRVVTAPPYYPEWKIAEGYKAGSYASETQNGMKIRRCPLYVPEHPSGITRMLHLFSFALSSLPILLRIITWRPDIIWTVAPDFFCIPGALLTAKLCGAKSWLHIQDFEIDAAFDLGLLKGNKIRQWALGLERVLISGFDRVSSISEKMIEKLFEKGIDSKKISLFPNWVDTRSVTPQSEEKPYRKELDIPKRTIVALYSGNMGKKQGLEILAETAKRLQPSSDKIQFIFCGTGAGKEDLSASCNGLSNVRFMDLQPLERLPDLLSMADIHLLPQRADAADLVMPSKLTGMLASGRPVAATAMKDTQVAKVVDGCGLVVPPGDAPAFSEAILQLSEDKGLRETLGAHARAYALNYLDYHKIMAEFEKELIRLASK